MKSHSELETENQLIKKLATNVGFYNYFFEMLKTSKTNIEAFNRANDQYFEFFGEYKYSCYKSFTVVNNRKIRNK
jgi:hypothetical protein